MKVNLVGLLLVPVCMAMACSKRPKVSVDETTFGLGVVDGETNGDYQLMPLVILHQLKAIPSRDLADSLLQSKLQEPPSIISLYKTTLIASDVSLAIETALALNDESMLKSALLRFADEDADAAFNLVAKSEDFVSHHGALADVISGISKRDPTKAFHLLVAMEPTETTRELMFIVVENWIQTDPEKALSSILSMESGPARESIFNHSVQIWSKRDPSRLLRWVDSVELSANHQQTVLRVALAEFASHSPEEAIDYCEKLGALQRRRVLPLVVNGMARSRPNSVLDWLAAEKDDQLVDVVLRQVGGTLAESAPKMVIELSQSYDAVKDSGLASALARVMQSDPDTGLVELEKWKEDPLYSDLISTVAKVYGATNGIEAVQWATSLEEGVKENALAVVVDVLSSAEPRRAIELLEELSKEGAENITSAAWAEVTENVARDDPQEAADFLEALPDVVKREAVLRLTNEWLRQDPEDAAQWLESLPDGELRDICAGRVVKFACKHDPKMAYDWARSISDRKARAIELERVFFSWIFADSAAAEQELKKSNLPEEVKFRIRSAGAIR